MSIAVLWYGAGCGRRSCGEWKNGSLNYLVDIHGSETHHNGRWYGQLQGMAGGSKDQTG